MTDAIGCLEVLRATFEESRRSTIATVEDISMKKTAYGLGLLTLLIAGAVAAQGSAPSRDDRVLIVTASNTTNGIYGNEAAHPSPSGRHRVEQTTKK